MLRIIVSIWGDMYGDEYIEKLTQSISEHTTVDWDITVLRNPENGWGEYSKKWYRGEGEPRVVQGEGWMNGYHHYNLGGIPLYKKMYPFGFDDHANENDICMYLDIDMVINGDLKYFTELNFDKPWVQYDYNMDESLLIKDYMNQNITPINTSVTVWKKGQLKPFYNMLEEYTDEVFFTYRRVDAYAWYNWGVKGFFNYLPQAAVDWNYNGSNSIISNLAGESKTTKDKVIING